MEEHGETARPVWPILLLFAGAVLPVAGFAVAGMLHGHSYLFDRAWMVETDALIAQGHFPPRHLPGLWGGIGGYDMFFYGPFPFWVASGVRQLFCASCEPMRVFAATAGLGLSLSILAFYLFARRFTAPLPAAIGAVVFGLLPYHLMVDWVWRVAVGEFWAYAFLPLVAAGMDAVLSERRLAPTVAVGFAGLCVSHLPTALLTAHVFPVVFLAWAWTRRDVPGEVLAAFGRLALLVATGALLAAAVWLPAFVLIDDVSPEALYDFYHSGENWLIGPTMTLVEPLLFSATLLCFVLSALVVLWFTRLPADRRPPRAALWAVVPLVVTFVLMTQLALPLWKYWIIAKVQFPWRLLVFCDLAAGLAAAILAREALARRVAPPLAVAALAGLLLVDLGYLAMRHDTREVTSNPVFADVQQGAAEYLPPPLFAEIVRRSGAPDAIFIRSGVDFPAYLDEMKAEARGFTEFTLGPRTATAVPEPGATEMLLPMAWWKHWQGSTSAGPVALAPDARFGVTLVRMPDDSAIAGPVTLTLPFLPSERLGAWLSLAGLVLLIAISAARIFRRTAP